MDNKYKSVLISHIAIPSNKIGSWNLMLTDLIDVNDSIFEYIISPKPDFLSKRPKNIIVQNSIKFCEKILFKIAGNRYLEKKQYWYPIRKILRKEDKLVLNVIDNIGILNALHYYACKENLRDRIFINFFFHGYFIDIDLIKIQTNFSLDKLVLLTNTSYQNLLDKSNVLPFEVAILPNGIKPNFKKVSYEEKLALRNELGFKSNKHYFLWVSQDRPKKGLKIILNAWKKVASENTNIELLIIGVNQKGKKNNIEYLGRIPNNLLPKYYQIADYFLFSTLCHEGHPLSLTEALKSGLKCIVSDIDPLSEILHNGNLGYLVDKPNMVDSWAASISFVLNNNYNFNKENIDLNYLYNFESWKSRFLEILNQSKQNFN
ncbi:glycosyltransferase family 4 protein [uncultured Polaribacter sp.]|uniref:glycosyltransferase family 4 protein n=1 Tax=uncultured Polaribacter sp. TaxID=174711 RepID=UPI00262B2C87|nr:glycosyltransferase family 4 protein [uncultured Polaribacter sp.]